jgi:hypothetical protein
VIRNPRWLLLQEKVLILDPMFTLACPWSVVLSRYSGFFHHQNWSPWYSRNIVESGVKHHKPTNHLLKTLQYYRSHKMLDSYTTLVVIGIDCTCSCKSNYHKITTTTVPSLIEDVKRWFHFHNINTTFNKSTFIFGKLQENVQEIHIKFIYLCIKQSDKLRWEEAEKAEAEEKIRLKQYVSLHLKGRQKYKQAIMLGMWVHDHKAVCRVP